MAIVGSSTSVVAGSTSITQKIDNETIAIADIEQSLALPTNIVGYLIRPRDSVDHIKLSHVSGESGTDFIKIPKTSNYVDEHRYAALTLYFQSPTVGLVVEVVTWK